MGNVKKNWKLNKKTLKKERIKKKKKTVNNRIYFGFF